VKRSPSLPDPDNGVMPERLDDVDRIVRAWTSERPDVDSKPLEVLSRVTRISKHLDRLRRAVFSVHGLDVWEFDVLATLRRAGKPYQLTPTALMAQTLVTSGAMTNRINRLEARGLVSRQADPEDGRRVVVALSDPGRKVVDRALDDLLSAEQRALEPLSSPERKELGSLLRLVSLHIESPDA
jgi:DNA-binding MarR family transcriptional regulator